MKKTNLHLISHTHWDREWYLSYETFRAELINLIDELLDILGKDSKFTFHLDGYTKLLDDYLEIKPQNKETLEKYIKNGNILTGPWYIQADEYLVSGESLIRNLLIGIRSANSYGKCMMVGYLPDQFGHIAQMPQILKGFGISSAIFARGIQTKTAEHCWEAINGDQVLGVSLTNWYGNCENIPETNISEYINNIYERQNKTTKSNNLLLMNGCDHLFPQKHSNLSLDNDKWSVNQTTMPKAIESIYSATDLNELPKRIGELRDDNEMFILASTHSSRVHLKTANYFLQNVLEKTIEPLASMLEITKKAKYPYDLIKHTWKLLIENHAHDSICGCSIDEVHREMEIRNEKVYQITKSIKNSLIKNDSNPEYINLINLSNYIKKEPIEVTINFPLGKKASDPGKEGEIELDSIKAINILDNDKTIDFCILDSEVKQKMVLTKSEVPLLQAQQEIKILLETKLEPFSTKSLKVITSGENLKEIGKQTPTKNKTSFENSFYELNINQNGTLNIKIKGSNIDFKELHTYSLEEDCGDLYRFMPKSKNTNILKELKWEIKIIEENSFRTIFEVRSLNFPGANIKTNIHCYNNSQRIDFESEINNSNKDKRLRIHFPTNSNNNEIFCDTQFGTIKRKRPSGFTNCAYVQPLHNFIDHSNNKHGLAFFGNGLSEYELSEDGNSFAVTLVRSIGKLSVVKSHSFIETPEAQCNKVINLKYSIYPHTNNKDLYDELSSIVNKPIASQSEDKRTMPSLLQTSNEVQVSALKRSEDIENLYLLRVFNPQDKQLENINLSLNFDFNKAYILNLNEEIIAEINNKKDSSYSMNGKEIQYNIKPFEVLTFGFKIK